MREVRPHRIAFVLSSLKFGGSERVALNLAYAFRAKGYEVDFILMQCVGEFLPEARAAFRVVDLRCRRTWQLPVKLGRYLFRERPKALISSFWKLNTCACIARMFWPSCRLVLWEHSPPSRSKNSPTWAYALSASVMYQLATSVVAVSTGVLADVRRITAGLGRKLTVIFNPVPPPPVLESAPSLSEWRTIIWVGRLDQPKNPRLAIEAFALLAFANNCILHMIGDGPLRDELEQLCAQLSITERVRFLGFRTDAYALMARADLLVLSSDREGLPTVLIEALNCGLSIVSTDCGEGIHDILLEGRYGTIVPAGNKHSLAAGMLRELDTPRSPEIQRTGAERFAPHEAARQFLAAIGRCVE